MLLGAGAVATKTYVDDVFSTFVYTGNSTARSINNGIDFGEGAMVWTKTRSAAYHHNLFDTVRTNGRTHSLASSSSVGEGNYGTDGITSFNSNGFSLGTDTIGALNDNNYTYTAWTFRKSPGFFDVVTWTGNETALRNISHSLGCKPGLILVKRTDSSGAWWVYHKDLGDTDSNYSKAIKLDSTSASFSDYKIGNRSKNTSTTFMVGQDPQVNGTGEYVAYLFGGASLSDYAVKFDGSDDYLSISDHADLDFGTGAVTIECFIKPNSFSNYQSIFGKFGSLAPQGYWLHTGASGVLLGGYQGSNSITTGANSLTQDQWHHVALVRNGTTVSIYLNGESIGTPLTTSDSIDNSADFRIGSLNASYPRYFDGEISNFRVTKGQALYTSNFTPTFSPLTQTSQGATSSNVKLLCCNGSSNTSSTVTPSSITANSSPSITQGIISSDTSANVFGDAGDQNVIKTGSYVGNGSSTGPDVYLGFEPQFILMKNAEKSENWLMWDSMRGIVTGGDDARLFPNLTTAESNIENFLNLTPTGFQINDNGGDLNENGDTIIFLAIRRPDGYVGKPPSLGTDVFTQAYGNYSSGNNPIPNFTAGFPVDFAWAKITGSTNHWYTSARLIQGKEVKTDQSAAESSGSNKVFDSNVGWHDNNGYDYYISHMWKRHAGFDVVTYEGDGVLGRQVSHSLNKTVEMAWVKCRNATKSWQVYHLGLNGGTNPQNYILELDESNAEGADSSRWNNTAPSSTHVTLGNSSSVNSSSNQYLMMLFASVDGISKVGYFDGSNSDLTITTGFQPRFLIVKAASTSGSWNVLDTTRGWGAGNDPYLKLDSNAAQNSGYNLGAPTATGFTLTGNMGGTNVSGQKYIYYCHA